MRKYIFLLFTIITLTISSLHSVEGITCAETESFYTNIGCQNSGGQVFGPTSIKLCADDQPYTLQTMNEVVDIGGGLPDVLWAVWVLDDPLDATISSGGPVPDDPFMPDDTNYIGLLNNGPGQIVFGTSVELIPDGSGVTYYISPLIGAAPGTFDSTCTGLDPTQGYTIYMNPPLYANIDINACEIQVELIGGFPLIDDTANYSWSYTTPDGQIVESVSPFINIISELDGNYTFSITNDGNDCHLLNFAAITINGCNCGRSVSFLQNTTSGLEPLPDTINTTDSPLQLIASPGSIPEVNGFITPAFGIHIDVDTSASSQNSLEIYNAPDGTGDLLAYWAPVDMGGPYIDMINPSFDFIAFREYIDPTLTYSFVWCDSQQTGFFQYQVINYALDDNPVNILAIGELNNNEQECFTINFGAPTGVATFIGDGISDTGIGQATFDPSDLEPGTYTITYSWDDGDNCSGFETQTIEVRLDSTVSTNQALYTDLIEVFPNPFDDNITVDISKSPVRVERFVLYDLNGRAIKTFILNHSSSNQYNVNELNAGLYFYEILNEKNELIGRGKLLK